MSSSRSAAATGGREAPRRDFQFSLRFVFLLMLALAAGLAIAAQFPKWSAFLLLMTGLTLLPLAVAGAMRNIVGRFQAHAGQEPTTPPAARLGWFRRAWLGAANFLGLRAASEVRLSEAAVIACLFMLAIVGLWPLLRELGLVAALIRTWSLEDVAGYARQGLLPTLSRGGYWTRLWTWELWAVARWWLLFGSLTLVWQIVSLPWRREKSLARQGIGGLARLLAFAPWLVVLEMLFLIGVWLQSPTTVPEPSTGFVVGIFSWDLWHWDCWRDRGWLIRGAAPTLLVGAVFFRRVLRWPWPPAALAGACLIPPALTLSVAWTVLWQNGW